jgi:hypothetical protein
LQEEDEGSDTEGLKDILPGDLLDTDLVNTIMNGDDDLTKNEDNLDDIGGKVLSDTLDGVFFIENFEHCSEVSRTNVRILQNADDKGKVVIVCGINVFEGMVQECYSLLTSALCGGEWSAL